MRELPTVLFRLSGGEFNEAAVKSNVRSREVLFDQGRMERLLGE